jgi:putative glycosyltransferase
MGLHSGAIENVMPVGLSIVTTLYQSAPFVHEFYRRAVAAAERLASSFEIIFVNDGSPDESLALALELFSRDPRVRVVDLSRNFGHHKALLTGLERASGELVFLLDVDLEESPEWLVEFHEVMRKTAADVVYGVQRHRKGGLVERVTGDIYYTVFNAFLEHPIPRNVVTARLMTRRYVTQLVQHRDREVCLAGLWVITGFSQVPVTVDKRRREGAAYGKRERLSVMVNALTSFSNRPLVFIFWVGCLLMLLSASAALYMVVRAAQRGIGVPGWPSLIVSIWFLGGLTIFCLGVIGIYLSKVFMEVKDRPYTVVRADHRHVEVPR